MTLPFDGTRRRFLTGRPPHPDATQMPLPPWLAASALDLCTGCGACAAACPTGIVKMTGERPALSFAAGECTFCGACAEACPEGLFDREREALPYRPHIAAHCLPHAGIDCQACRDVCPQEAIRFPPRRGGPFLPQVTASLCSGCGACVAPCPVSAIGLRPVPEAFDA